jgi:hypothetical protein
MVVVSWARNLLFAGVGSRSSGAKAVRPFDMRKSRTRSRAWCPYCDEFEGWGVVVVVEKGTTAASKLMAKMSFTLPISAPSPSLLADTPAAGCTTARHPQPRLGPWGTLCPPSPARPQ